MTRWVAAAVIPFLIAAFVILYFMPDETAQLFAWETASPITAALMGAGYLGGAYFFARLLMEKRWHRVGAGFLPVAIFTIVMLATTLLHWDTFDPTHWAFLVNPAVPSPSKAKGRWRPGTCWAGRNAPESASRQESSC